MEKLFQEFDDIGIDQWIDKIYTDLKDKPKDLLVYQPEFDLSVKSFYHRSEATKGHFSNGKISNSWSNRKIYNEATNKLILNDLNEGINCLGLHFQDQASFDELTKDVQFEHIEADLKFDNLLAARSFIGPGSIRLNYDIIGQSLKIGKWTNSIEDFTKFYREHNNNQSIWISGSLYGEAGSTCSQELAFTANHINEYIHVLSQAGVSLSDINQKLVVELSVTEDYFVNIAKFKLIKYIVGLVFSAYDAEYKLQPFTVMAKTSKRFMAVNDHNNNLLRQSTMAMSAIIGGCDVITVQTFPNGNWDKNQIMERMAKNIPLVLKEESYLDKVADASEGSYYIEYLCAQMMRISWDLFKEIENQGGLIASTEKGLIKAEIEKNQQAIIKAINDGEKTFLGVNKYPSSIEEWQVIPAEEVVSGVTFEPLTTFRAELKYNKTLHEQN